jgi:hypothetical protein
MLLPQRNVISPCRREGPDPNYLPIPHNFATVPPSIAARSTSAQTWGPRDVGHCCLHPMVLSGLPAAFLAAPFRQGLSEIGLLVNPNNAITESGISDMQTAGA